jgi:choline kinase
MPAIEQAIILAAGRGNQVDGMAKALIRHPMTGQTILQHAINAFAGKRVVAVVGFRAIQVMETHPDIDYVINHEWAITNNAMSVGLALDDVPTYVVSGDIFFDRPLIEYLDQQEANLALTETRENRPLTAIHCVTRADGSISSTYQGLVQSVLHPEAIGLFKISDLKLLHRWKRLCLAHANMFAGQVIPCDGTPIKAVPRKDHGFDEINTAADYLRLMERSRSA